MPMRQVCVGLASFLVFSAISAAQSRDHKAIQPDIFLITIDTLRADHIHCYGYNRIQTPALDGLANDGIRFANAFTPSPITNTSHASILTGLMPSSHGMTDFGTPLAPHPTLPELLKKQGYVTAAFIGSIILDSRNLARGLDRGFDFYDNFPKSTKNKSRWNRVERRAETVAEHAERWLSTHPGNPRFVWVHLYDPHDPYEPPPPYSQTYKDSLYDGEIAYADSALMGFLASLKLRGWYQNSLVIAVGDHGEGLGDHQEDTHGIFLYDSTTHVPLIIKLPKAQSARKVVQTVSTLDILPTVLSLLRLPAPDHIDGHSLLSDADQANNREVLAETDYPLRFGWAPLHSVRSQGFKFIDAPRPELYDLRSDPAELRNQYAPWDARVQTSRVVLASRKSTSSAFTQPSGSLGQNTIDELKALGYLGRNDAASSTNVPEPSLLPDPKDHIQEQNLLHRAMIADEDNRPGDARRALERVLELNPNMPVALTQLGELELEAGENLKAAGHLKTAREMLPKDARLAFEEGTVLARLKDLNGARDALLASLQISPAQAQTRVLLGQVFLELKQPQQAEDQFQAALLLQPHDTHVLLQLARAQIASGEFASALRTLNPLAKSPGATAEAFDLLATAYEASGQPEGAERARKRADSLRRNGEAARSKTNMRPQP